MNLPKIKTILSEARINRYYYAVNCNEKKTKKLYQYNLKLSQEMFSVISCFEVILRNAINKLYSEKYGESWLENSVKTGGRLDNLKTQKTKELIFNLIKNIEEEDNENKVIIHNKLVSRLNFGVWKYMFATPQYTAMNKILLKIFIKKKKGNKYNNTYVFNELDLINDVRNRIAHHEPICFNKDEINTINIRENYKRILMFLEWLDIDGKKLFNQLKLNKVIKICDKIDNLKKNCPTI